MQQRGQGSHGSMAEHGCEEHTVPVNVYVAMPHDSVKKAATLVDVGRSRVFEDGHKRINPLNSLNFNLNAFDQARAQSQPRKEGAVVVVCMGEVNSGALIAQTLAIREICDRYGA